MNTSSHVRCVLQLHHGWPQFCAFSWQIRLHTDSSLQGGDTVWFVYLRPLVSEQSDSLTALPEVEVQRCPAAITSPTLHSGTRMATLMWRGERRGGVVKISSSVNSHLLDSVESDRWRIMHTDNSQESSLLRAGWTARGSMACRRRPTSPGCASAAWCVTCAA